MTPAHITHRRFLGYDDYQAYVCIQYSGKDINETEECEEVIRLNKEPVQEFNCPQCNYVTKRLEVFIMHTKLHIQGRINPNIKRKNKKRPTKRPRPKKKDNDSSSDELDSVKPPKRKPKIQHKKAKKDSNESISTESSSKPTMSPTHIRNDLLAEWEDSDDNDGDDLRPMESTIEKGDGSESESTFNDSIEYQSKLTKNDSSEDYDTTMNETRDNEKDVTMDCSSKVETEKSSLDESVDKELEVSDREGNKKKVKHEQLNEIKKDIKSCFDFDEEEEDDTPIVETGAGRKIPRVIPPSEKRRSLTDEVNESGENLSDVEKAKQSETLKESESFNISVNEDKDDDHDKTFHELLESTSVPTLTDIENTLKSEQNFHDTKTIKFPDKTEPTESQATSQKPATPEKCSEVATKLTNPKKRFVKSFKDEIFQSNIKKKAEENRSQEEFETKEQSMEVVKQDQSDLFSNVKSDATDKIEDSSAQSTSDVSNSEVNVKKTRRSTRSMCSPKNETPAETKSDDFQIKDRDVADIDSSNNVLLSDESKEATLPVKISSEENVTNSPVFKETDSINLSPTHAETSRPEKNEMSLFSDKNVKISKLKSKMMSKIKLEDEKRAEDKYNRRKTRRSNSKRDEYMLLNISEESSPTSKHRSRRRSLRHHSHESPVFESVESTSSNKIDRKENVEPQNDDPIQHVANESVIDSPVKEIVDTFSEGLKSAETASLETVNESNEKSVVEETVQPDIQVSSVVTDINNSLTESVLTESGDKEASLTATEENGESSERIEEVSGEEKVQISNLAQEIVQDFELIEEEVVNESVEELSHPVEKDENLLLSSQSETMEIVEEKIDFYADKDAVIENSIVIEETSKSEDMDEKCTEDHKEKPNVDQVQVNSMEESNEDTNANNLKIKNETEIPYSNAEHISEDAVSKQDKIETESTHEEQQDNQFKIVETSTAETDIKENETQSKMEEIANQTNENVLEFSFEDSDGVIDKKDSFNLNELFIQSASPKQTDPEKYSDKQVNKRGENDPEELVLKANLSKAEELSALTLASLATATSINSVLDQGNKTESTVVGPPLNVLESETVPIAENNLTVVTEKELIDSEVEFTDASTGGNKPVTLMNFSMDFSESVTDSSSSVTKNTPEREVTKVESIKKSVEIKKTSENKKPSELKSNSTSNKYERLELLDILEGNTQNMGSTAKEKSKPLPSTYPNDILDFEEHIPSQIVRTKNAKVDIITEPESEDETSVMVAKKSSSKFSAHTVNFEKSRSKDREVDKIKQTPNKMTKVKAGLRTTTKPTSSKPIILSEQIIKPADATPKASLKRPFDDIEDVEAFIIPKNSKKATNDDVDTKTSTTASKSGKAKILQQTIITPQGEIIQPKIAPVQTDDNIFDINSMPIVLSDDITPESIESMSIVFDDSITTSKSVSIPKTKVVAQTKIIPKPAVTNIQSPVIKAQTKSVKPGTRIIQNPSSKLIKHTTILPSTVKTNSKYVIMPQSSALQTELQSKGRKPTLIKRMIHSPVEKGNSLSEPVGNKIMVVTNNQGEQQRVLLTPTHQRMLGCSSGTAKISKPVTKTYIQKAIINPRTPSTLEGGSSGVTKIIRTIRNIGSKVSIASSQNSPTQTISGTPQRNLKPVGNTTLLNKTPRHKTVLIKNQFGQTVKTIQGPDDELLEKQVAEQLEAIKASSAMRQQANKQQEVLRSAKLPAKKSHLKKINTVREPLKPKSPVPSTSRISQTIPKSEAIVPPLAPISPKKQETTQRASEKPTEQSTESPAERQLNQLVIQDALGNQTTITEGQILALPSETVDGQPQSYMLVTLDESGNLTPLNSEALMSLDPNLLGGDLGNMVLQVDQSAVTGSQNEGVLSTQTAVISSNNAPEMSAKVTESVVESPVSKPISVATPTVSEPVEVSASTSTDAGQQLIVTGDPIATQKFLESLTEGTTDLANILANAEGSSIIIQADGQQILINTNSNNPMMSLNNDNVENTESGGNPMFATQPSKNQDILAAALADTDVFQQDQNSVQAKIQSQLSPGSTLYPMNVSNVLETSLTLSSPIMTPLEVPSTNSKKIPDEEADILTQVPKNVGLPITITDPNISQTVAHQQVLLANDLQTNLELNLPISEATISAPSSEMNSPSFVYSLPTLDDINQKPFSSSMPLLTEDVEETTIETSSSEDKNKSIIDGIVETTVETTIGIENVTSKKNVSSDSSFMEEEEGLCTLGGEMCSSLSEPPPDMFDLQSGNFLQTSKPNTPNVISQDDEDEDSSNTTATSIVESNSPATATSENSCEIPIQAEIVTDLSVDLADSNLSSNRNSADNESDSLESKKM